MAKSLARRSYRIRVLIGVAIVAVLLLYSKAAG